MHHLGIQLVLLYLLDIQYTPKKLFSGWSEVLLNRWHSILIDLNHVVSYLTAKQAFVSCFLSSLFFFFLLLLSFIRVSFPQSASSTNTLLFMRAVCVLYFKDCFFFLQWCWTPPCGFLGVFNIGDCICTAVKQFVLPKNNVKQGKFMAWPPDPQYPDFQLVI